MLFVNYTYHSQNCRLPARHRSRRNQICEIQELVLRRGRRVDCRLSICGIASLCFFCYKITCPPSRALLNVFRPFVDLLRRGRRDRIPSIINRQSSIISILCVCWMAALSVSYDIWLLFSWRYRYFPPSKASKFYHHCTAFWNLHFQ